MTDLTKAGFGAVLRRRREELGLTFDDVAASTRIRKTYLQALEEENLSALPGAAYSVGFLRIYARQLGLSAAPLLASRDGAEPGDEHSAALSAGSDRPRSSRGGKAGKPVGRPLRGGRLILLFGVLLGTAGAYLYLRPPVPPLAPQRLAPAPAPAPAVAPTQPAVVPQPPAAPPTGMMPAAGGEAEVAVIELPVIPLEGAVVRMLPVAAGILKVSLDNQESREYPLQPDQALNWKVTRSLAVEFSAPGLVRIWVDQQELAVADSLAYVLKRVPRREGEP